AVEELTKGKRQQTLFSQDLTVKQVFSSLQQIASFEGNKSTDNKLGELNKLLTSANPLEAKFIVRTVLEDLRVGIAIGTLRDAIFYAFFCFSQSYNKETNTLEHEPKEGATLKTTGELIKRALDLTADPGQVILHIKEGKSLEEFKLHYGSPSKVMLARKERTFEEAFARTGLPARLEYKYDGFRLQMHKFGNEVHLFTRRLEDVTTQFPDVVRTLKEQVAADKVILDGEAVGYDPKTGKYEPFQHISKRIKRKHNIQGLVEELPVEVNIFDILKIDEQELLDRPLDDRLEVLKPLIQEKDLIIRLAKGILTSSEQEANVFYQEALAKGNEGIMIKDLKGTYEPGGRVSAWIKMKPTMEDLDLVIVEAEWGSGKRSEWMTSFTLACIDEDGELLEIGKVGTGLKEIDDGESVSFPKITELLRPLIISEKGKLAKVKPEIVIAVTYEEIQKSPSYASGFALRFPRVVNLRPDRMVDDIATREEVIDLFESQ
ncbi:MAG: ATP-dependent DNA ligase, partial [Nanoarchaeota archaeon]|nr:ATP-dependent DNA ligase [Nanoarchaeota archaeon]